METSNLAREDDIESAADAAGPKALPKSKNRQARIPPEGPDLFVPGWFRAEELRELRGAPLSVLLSLVSHADSKGLTFPGVDLQMHETGYGRAAVKNGRAKLEKAGWVRVVQHRNNKTGLFGRKIYQLAWKLKLPVDVEAESTEPGSGKPGFG
jgi:hypothetical protein